jgi:IS5 family transposase
MSTPDFFRARLDGMVDLRHPLVVLTGRLPWAQIEQVLAPHFERKARTAGTATAQDMLGEHAVEFGGGIGSGGRPRLPIRLMASLLYLKNSFNLSDEELVARWSENVVWQFFSGLEYYEPRLPCDATQIGRFRTVIGEEGLEQLLKFTIQTAVEIKAIKPADLERVIVDSTVQEKAIAHPVDSRLLEIARYKVVKAAGIALKQTFAAEGKELRRKAGGYAHAKQFKRLKKVVQRQRTILGVVMREVQRKLDAQAQAIAAGGAPDMAPAGATAPVRAEDPARTRRAHPHAAASRQEQAQIAQISMSKVAVRGLKALRSVSVTSPDRPYSWWSRRAGNLAQSRQGVERLKVGTLPRQGPDRPYSH